MSNPDNLCVHYGEISSTPHYIKTKTGTTFACEFFLAVERNYRNQGVFLKDNVPMRLEGEAIMPFAQNLKEGVKLKCVSSYVTKIVGDKHKAYFLISDIKQINEKTTCTETGDGYVELPL